MTREILLISEAYGGGVKTHIDSIRKYSKHSITVIIFSEKNKENPENNIYIGKGRRNIFNFLLFDTLKLTKFIVRKKIKIVHTHSTFCGLQGIVLKCIIPDLKIIFTPHAYYSQKPKLSYFKKKIILFLERIIVKFSNVVIHVSESEELHAINYNILTNQKHKSHVIYNGVKNPRDRNKPIVSNEKKIRIGSLSRLIEQKNPLRFLELAKAVQSKDKSSIFEFYYGGEGPLKEQVQKYIYDNNMESYFFLLGSIPYENIEKDFFDKIDIYMSTALYEGLPYSVVEAISYRKPVILSNVIGHKELYMNNGLIFDLENQNSIIAAEIINTFSREKISELSKKSYLHFGEYFDVEKNISLIDKVYKGEWI